MSLMNTFKSLFGGNSGTEPHEARTEESIEYKNCLISPAPIKEGNQYRTAGTISQSVSNSGPETGPGESAIEPRETRFIRADNHASRDQAVEHCISKAKQIIDERGDRLFDSERC